MKTKKIAKSSLKSLKSHALKSKANTAGFASDIEEKITSFIRESFGDDAFKYGEKAVKWVKKNPTASTTLAVVSALAIGAMVKSALSSEHQYS